MVLQAYHRQRGFKTFCARIFTAYGERENETHAIVALIAKAFVKCDPYPIWGSGEQDRNFTYVGDTVDGLILGTEKVEDGSPINVGRSDHVTINETIETIFELSNFRPKDIFRDLSKPVGVFSRAADNTKCRELLGWEPTISIDEGLRRTMEWYMSTHDETTVRNDLDKLLMER